MNITAKKNKTPPDKLYPDKSINKNVPNFNSNDLQELLKEIGISSQEFAGLLTLPSEVVTEFIRGDLEDIIQIRLIQAAMEPANLISLINLEPDILDTYRRDIVIKRLHELEQASLLKSY